MKKTLMSALAVAALLGTALPGTAARARAEDELQPMLVVSFAGYAELKRDLEYLGTASDNADLAKSAEGLLMMFTQNQGLAGLDEERPWGAAIGFGDSGPPGWGWVFLPVTDLQRLFGALGGLIGEPQDAGNDTWQLEKNGQSVFVKQQGDWAFLSATPDMLANLPADPAKLLDGLPKQYDLAARIQIQNIPPPVRDMAIDGIKQQIELRMQPSATEDDTQAQLIRAQAETLAKSINELDQITLGFSIDGEGKRSFVDVDVTALEGSEAARQLRDTTPGESKFTGFLLPGSLFSMHFNAAAEEQDLPPTLSLLGKFRSQVMEELDKDDDFDDDEQRATIKELVGELLDVAEETLKKGRINLGLAVVGAGPINVALGGFVADGQRLEEAVKKLADMATGEADSPAIKLDVAEHDGVRFHSVTFPKFDGADAQVQELLGDPIEVTVGFGNESFFVALGPDGIGTIKQVMERSMSSTPELSPLHWRLAVGQVLDLAAKGGNPIAGMAAAMLQRGQDHVHLLVQPLANGAQYRIEIEEGILKLIGNASKMFMPGAGNL